MACTFYLYNWLIYRCLSDMCIRTVKVYTLVCVNSILLQKYVLLHAWILLLRQSINNVNEIHLLSGLFIAISVLLWSHPGKSFEILPKKRDVGEI